MAFRISTAVFRREVERRLMDVHAVQALTGLHDKSSVFKRVKAKTLPPPIISGSRRFALWDRDEVENFVPKEKGA
jgi:predicted DNA-binding transcriptional regulator AlpA